MPAPRILFWSQCPNLIQNLESAVKVKGYIISDSNQIRSHHNQYQSQFTFKHQNQIKSYHNQGNFEPQSMQNHLKHVQNHSQFHLEKWMLSCQPTPPRVLVRCCAQGSMNLTLTWISVILYFWVTKTCLPVFVSLRWVQTRKPRSRLESFGQLATERWSSFGLFVVHKLKERKLFVGSRGRTVLLL